MELRQLRYFVAIAENLSFSEAARKLFISQSTLSQQIRQLEDELGSPLLRRDSHNVTLTEAGDRLLPLAITTLHDAETCKIQVSDLKESLSGTLNIGVTHSFSSIFFETMKTFITTYKGVTLNVRYANTCKLLEMLRRHEIDFALAYKSPHVYDDVESHLLFKDQLCMVVNKEHALANRQSITLKDLEGFGIAMPSKELQARHMLDRYLDKENVKLRVRIELNDANFILDLLDNSKKLVAILPAGTIRTRHNLAAVPLDIPHNEMRGCVHVLKGKYVKRSAEIFVKMIRESDIVRYLMLFK